MVPNQGPFLRPPKRRAPPSPTCPLRQEAGKAGEALGRWHHLGDGDGTLKGVYGSYASIGVVVGYMKQGLYYCFW